MTSQTAQKPQLKEYKVAILTPYLSEGIEQFSSPAQFVQQALLYGYDPNNLNGLEFLQTNNGSLVTIDSPHYERGGRKEVQIRDIENHDLIITGSTEPCEDEVRAMKGTGLIVARFSIFYGKPSGYSGVKPEDGGYSLDLPKAVGCAVALLKSDDVLEALVLREESKIRTAIDELNKGREPVPILITPYLAEALKVQRAGGEK